MLEDFTNELNKINLLNKKVLKIENSKISQIQKIFLINSNCKIMEHTFCRFGKDAFICRKILDSLLHKKLLSKEEYTNIFQSFNTIAKSINNDYLESKKNLKKKSFFISKYGHLRPLTYSISSLNFKEGYNFYFSKNTNKIKKKNLKLRKLILKKFQIILKKMI